MPSPAIHVGLRYCPISSDRCDQIASPPLTLVPGLHMATWKRSPRANNSAHGNAGRLDGCNTDEIVLTQLLHRSRGSESTLHRYDLSACLIPLLPCLTHAAYHPHTRFRTTFPGSGNWLEASFVSKSYKSPHIFTNARLSTLTPCTPQTLSSGSDCDRKWNSSISAMSSPKRT